MNIIAAEVPYSNDLVEKHSLTVAIELDKAIENQKFNCEIIQLIQLITIS